MLVGQMTRNLNIDIFRMIFALVVVLHHYFPKTWCGYFAVDFFFIVSGFFLMKSYNKYDDTDRPHNLRFCAHKLMSFLPYLIVAEIIAAITVLGIQLANNGDWNAGMKLAWNQLKNILCLSMLNIYKGDVTWYLSAMILATAILYPCVRAFKEKFSRIIAPIIGIVLLLAIIISTGRTNYPDELLLGFIRKGLILGISDMCLGIFSYEVVEYLRRLGDGDSKRMVYTAMETICYLTVLVCIFIVQPRGESWRGAFEFTMIALLFIGTTITLSNLSYTYDLTMKQDWLWKYANVLSIGSLMIYLNHEYVIKFWKHLNFDIPNLVSIMMVILLTTIMSVVCYYIGKMLYDRMKRIDVNKLMS